MFSLDRGQNNSSCKIITGHSCTCSWVVTVIPIPKNSREQGKSQELLIILEKTCDVNKFSDIPANSRKFQGLVYKNVTLWNSRE